MSKKTPKRRKIEHKPVEVSSRQKIREITKTLQLLDEQEEKILAEQRASDAHLHSVLAQGRAFVSGVSA